MPARLPEAALPETGTIEPANKVAGSNIMPDSEQLRRRSRSGSLNRDQLSDAAATAVQSEPTGAAATAASEQANEPAVGMFSAASAVHVHVYS